MAERRPQNCRACGKLMGVAEECPYCGRSRNSPVGYMTSLLGWASGPNGISVTKAIMGFCGFIFLLGLVIAVWLGGPGTLVDALFRPPRIILQILGSNSPMVFAGAWWTVITSLFLHIGLIHLGFNLYALSIVGPIMESSLGRGAFWVLFVFSGAFGAILSAWNGSNAAGASGAIMGLVGAGIVISLLAGRRMDDPLLKTLVMWVGLTFLFGVFSGMHIDNWGHFGGFIGGGAFAVVWYQFRRGRRTATQGMNLLAGLTFAVVVLAYVSHVMWLF